VLSVCFVFLFIFLLMVRFMKAYILIKLRSGVDLEGVLKEVRSKMGVKKASLVFGPFDLIAEIEVEDEDALKDVIHELHSIEGISETLTCVVTKSL